MKKRTRLLSLFLTVAILIASMVLVLPTTAQEDDANPTNSINPANTGDTEEPIEPAPLPTEYWSEHMAYTFANGVRLGQEGYGTEKKPYEISTAEELAYFAWLVNRGPGYNMTGKYFMLTADVDLSAYMWEPIAKTYSPSNSYDYDGDGTKDTWQMTFAGVFDGGGHTISGLNFHNNYYDETGKLPAEYGGLALFGTLRGASSAVPAIVRNLNIVGSADLTDYAYVASNFGGPIAMCATAAYANAYIRNVNVTADFNVSCKTAGVLVAGLLGYQTAGATIENCTVKGDITVDNSANAIATFAGGFVARVNGTAVILNSTNNANVTVKTKSNTALAGGFVAKNESNNATNPDSALEEGLAELLYLSGCVNNGNVVIQNPTGGSGTLLSAAGGFVGIAGLGGKGDTCVVNSVNTGLIQVDNMGNTGGVAAIIGLQRTERAAVEDCYSTTEPVCLNETEVSSRGFDASFIYTEGALRLTNEKVETKAKWLTPDSCIFLPETAITTAVGAALRLNPSREGVASLLFMATLDKDFLELMADRSLTFGLMLVEADLAREAAQGALTTTDMMKKLGAGDVRKLSALTYTEDGELVAAPNNVVPEDRNFYSVLTNIKADGYAKEYLPLGYVSLVLDASTGLELTFYSACLIEDESAAERTLVVDEKRIVSVKELAQLYYNLRADVKDDVNVNEVGEAHRVEGLGNYSQFTDAELDLFKLYMSEPTEEEPPEEAPDETPDPTPDTPPVADPEIDTDMEEIVEGGTTTPDAE